MAKMNILIILALSFFSCSKEDASQIMGKWYHYSTDSKKGTGNGCDLRDTTKLQNTNQYGTIYEFLTDGKMNITLIIQGQSNTFPSTYKFENNKLTYTLNGQISPAITISNLSSEGWRYEQQNFIWCPSKTAFTEYLNFKKY